MVFVAKNVEYDSDSKHGIHRDLEGLVVERFQTIFFLFFRIDNFLPMRLFRDIDEHAHRHEDDMEVAGTFQHNFCLISL